MASNCVTVWGVQVSLSIKSALVQFIYDKSLKISLRSKADLGSGVVNNLMSNDAAKLVSIPQYGHVLWSAPFQVSHFDSFLLLQMFPSTAVVH
jgi:hypothetical protein